MFWYLILASVRSGWDSSYLYFLIQVLDSRQKHIPPNKFDEREIFVDYGWIEDEKGEIIWRMKAKDTKHAGGAYKNQMVDTVLTLNAGKYSVKYISDESHAYNNWNDDPPETPFYGIILYESENE